MEDEQKIVEISKRRKYFDVFFPEIIGQDFRKDVPKLPNSCPCCGYLTLERRCSWEICAFCFWEDDGQDDIDANIVEAGPNGGYSLTEYRLIFFDELRTFKNNQVENSPAFLIGKELTILDNLIYNQIVDNEIAFNQIKLLTTLFDDLRMQL